MSVLHSERVRWLLSAVALVMLVLIVLQLISKPRVSQDPTVLLQAAPSVASVPSVSAPEASAATIVVDVIGAVQQPGVYRLAVGARVDDAVKAAGGLAPDSARDQINLAAPVTDGSQIKVPRVGEAPAQAAEAGSAADGLVNINTADVAELDTLPGIGPATAQAIVDHRSGAGSFTSIDDLQDVKGIGPSLFAQLQGRVTLGP